MEGDPHAHARLRCSDSTSWTQSCFPIVWRQLLFPVVLPHLEMLPKNQARGCPEFESAAMKINRPSRPFCRILDLVGEAEAGSGGVQPAKESYEWGCQGKILFLLPCEGW